jgi:hypothetical protein
VLVLSLPAFIPSLITDSAVPRGAYSWLHVTHEFSKDSPPPVATIIGEADFVARDLCEPNHNNRNHLFDIFAKEISERMTVAYRGGCWEIHQRRY